MMAARGLRNNNPGNIRLSRTVWQGEIRPSRDRSFCQFRTMAYGYRALIKLLQNYRRNNGCRTIADFINRWAPPVENNTSGYISRVCREMQVPNTVCARCERPGNHVRFCRRHLTGGKRSAGSNGGRGSGMGTALMIDNP